MIYSSTSHVGLVKKESQDALGHLFTDLGTLFVVCDGVSGLPNGALASQIALAWVISHPNVIAIPGAKSVEQVRQNAAAVDIQLTLSEIADLTEVSDSYKTALHVPRVFEAFKWLFSRN